MRFYRIPTLAILIVSVSVAYLTGPLLPGARVRGAVTAPPPCVVAVTRLLGASAGPGAVGALSPARLPLPAPTLVLRVELARVAALGP